MKVKNLIDKLMDLPQDYEVTAPAPGDPLSVGISDVEVDVRNRRIVIHGDSSSSPRG